MKKLLLIAAVIAAGASLQAQSVIFANTAAFTTTGTALVTDTDGTALKGPAFVGNLYLVNGDGSLTAVGSPIAFSATKGGQIVDTNPRATSLAAGAQGKFEIGAWGSSFATLADAQAAPGAHWGLSAPVTLNVGNDANPTVPPPGLAGLAAFSLVTNPTVTPEPTTLALGALGLGALLLRRRS